MIENKLRKSHLFLFVRRTNTASIGDGNRVELRCYHRIDIHRVGRSVLTAVVIPVELDGNYSFPARYCGSIDYDRRNYCLAQAYWNMV